MFGTYKGLFKIPKKTITRTEVVERTDPSFLVASSIIPSLTKWNVPYHASPGNKILYI